MTSCIDNEMEDREYCPLSPEGILFLSTERKHKKQKKKYEMVSEALGQRADVHPCTFEREVI